MSRAIVVYPGKGGAARDLRIEERGVAAPGPGEVRVRIVRGGICGSDLHYYNHGGFGAVRLREPMVLGHEVSGHVDAVGEGVDGLAVGDLIAVSPSRPCGACRYCREGLPNHCLHMRFYGSAMPMPHIQGAFQEVLVADAAQCVRAMGLTPGEAAMAEPLAVVLHAARQAGDLLGRRVLVTGCGPIGALAILVARAAGAREIAATDIAPNALEVAREIGADRAVDASDPDALREYEADKGTFDVMFECTGVAAALASGIGAMRPGGTVVQLGLGGDMSLPVQTLTAKELALKGSFRFHEEFEAAVAAMQGGRIDVTPLISATLPLSDTIGAFDLAGDRSRATKVQIDFAG